MFLFPGDTKPFGGRFRYAQPLSNSSRETRWGAGPYLFLNLFKKQSQEEVELLLGSYSADLDEIETEIKIFIDMIEDTDQFISAHLDSVRNEIIKMSLFIEVGGLIMGFGAVVSGIFGMNLKNHVEVNRKPFLNSKHPF